MHRAGVWHADLNAFNLLLDEQGDAWLIDFDRGRYGAVAPNERRSNLLRLRRSLDKVAGSAGIAAWEGIDQAYRKAWDSHH
jgi:3-deoxy-D-manno-octulosonic acid kinase